MAVRVWGSARGIDRPGSASLVAVGDGVDLCRRASGSQQFPTGLGREGLVTNGRSYLDLARVGGACRRRRRYAVAVIIVSAFLCAKADVHGHGVTIEGGDIGMVGLDAIPGELQLDLWVHLQGRPDELSKVHSRRLRLLSADNEPLGEQNKEFGPVERIPIKPPGFQSGLNWVVDIQGFEIQNEGWYRLEVWVDEDQRVLPFYVYEEIPRTGALGEAVASIEATGRKVDLYPRGIYDEPNGMEAQATALVWEDGARNPIVGRGPDIAAAVEAARRQLP